MTTLDEMFEEWALSSRCDLRKNVSGEYINWDTHMCWSSLRACAENLLNREPTMEMLRAGSLAVSVPISPDYQREMFNAMLAKMREELGMK
jgi:hypothetical protein